MQAKRPPGIAGPASCYRCKQESLRVKLILFVYAHNARALPYSVSLVARTEPSGLARLQVRIPFAGTDRRGAGEEGLQPLDQVGAPCGGPQACAHGLSMPVRIFRRRPGRVLCGGLAADAAAMWRGGSAARELGHWLPAYSTPAAGGWRILWGSCWRCPCAGAWLTPHRAVLRALGSQRGRRSAAARAEDLGLAAHARDCGPGSCGAASV